MPSWENGNNPWLPFGVHHHNLTQAGVHQIQNLNLTELAQTSATSVRCSFFRSALRVEREALSVPS